MKHSVIIFAVFFGNCFGNAQKTAFCQDSSFLNRLRIGELQTKNKIDTIPTIGKEGLSHLYGGLGPSLTELKSPKLILIVNGIVVKNQKKIDIFWQFYVEGIRTRKYYNKLAGFKRYGVSSRDGILVIKMKRKVLMDLEILCVD